MSKHPINFTIAIETIATHPNFHPYPIDSHTPKDVVVKAYASAMIYICDHLRLANDPRHQHVYARGDWSWVEPHPDQIIGLYSPEVARFLGANFHQVRVAQTYEQGQACDKTLVDILNFDAEFHAEQARRANLPGWQLLGMVPNYLIRNHATGAPKLDYEATRINLDANLNATQPMLKVSDPFHHEGLYFYTTHLIPLLHLMRAEENVLVFLQPTPFAGTTSQAEVARHVAIVGHNWRTLIRLYKNPSEYTKQTTTMKTLITPPVYDVPCLTVSPMIEGKQLRRSRRLDPVNLYPRDEDLFAFVAAPAPAPAPAPALLAMTLKSTTVSDVMEASKGLPAPTRPHHAAVRLGSLPTGAYFVRATGDVKRMYHPDNVLITSPYPPFGQRKGMRPVMTRSAITNDELELELPNDTWVVEHEPAVPQSITIDKPRTPDANPHGYQTTEGLKHRLNKSIF